jgi:hypothetical protein
MAPEHRQFDKMPEIVALQVGFFMLIWLLMIRKLIVADFV